MASSLPLVVVDIQPCYSSVFAHGFVGDIVAEIERRIAAGLPVYLVHNDLELSGDQLGDVHEFWLEHGLSEDVLERCQFIEKQYAELRGWMDCGVSDDDIVKTLQALRQAKLWDSRLLPAEALESLSPDGSELCNPLFLSWHLESSPLTSLVDMDICGGGREECLREVELWLESRKLPYNRIESLVY